MKKGHWMRQKIYILIPVSAVIAFIGACITVRSVEASDIPQTETFEMADCMFTLPEGVEEGIDVVCGYVTVPEQHAVPDGPTIKLAVVIIKSKESPVEADAVFFAQGGPGGSTIDAYATTLLDSSLRADRDLVLFDQRGTYYSEPSLVCTEIMDITIETLDQNLSSEESDRLFMQALRDCQTRLKAKGINLSAYNSLENAADIASIRSALGYEQINLYGVSYGTLLALHTMRLYPEILRSVVIDSVVPTQRNFVLEAPRSEDRAFTTLFESCKTDKHCNRAYPNLEEVFFKLVDQFNKTPAKITLTDPTSQEVYPAILNGDGFQAAVFQMLYSSEIIPMLPRLIYDIRDGKYAIFETFYSLLTFNYTMSYGMYYSVLCAEDADFTLSEYNLSGLHPQIVESETDSAKFLLDTCQMWNVDYLGPQLDEPVQSNIPTLILTGYYDPITPPEYARQAAETLPNSYLVEFPDGGHGELNSSDCADGIFLQFIANPNTPPDTSCLAKHERVRFYHNRNMLFLDSPRRLLNLQGSSAAELIVFGVCLFFCLSAFVLYPINWLIKLISKKARAVSGPLFYQLFPWAAALNAAALLAFFIGFAAGGLIMALNNDMRFLYGFPVVWLPLFLLPPAAFLLTIALLYSNIAAWVKRCGSLTGRLYGALLVLASCGAVAVLMRWGVVSVLLFN
jgi:pimeloyl-ACP methyl ester carboxylesterase